MVTETDDLFKCEACGLRYEERKDAEECEQFCRENDACSTEIIERSVDT